MKILSKLDTGHVLSTLSKLRIDCFSPVFGLTENQVSIFLPKIKKLENYKLFKKMAEYN